MGHEISAATVKNETGAMDYEIFPATVKNETGAMDYVISPATVKNETEGMLDALAALALTRLVPNPDGSFRQVTPEELIVEFKFGSDIFDVELTSDMDFDEFQDEFLQRVNARRSGPEVTISRFLTLYRLTYLDDWGRWVPIVCKEDYKYFWKWAEKQPIVKMACKKSFKKRKLT